jgi:hypothetical protein
MVLNSSATGQNLNAFIVKMSNNLRDGRSNLESI